MYRILGKETGFYKHAFEIPSDWKGKTVKIVFEGAMTDTKVKINGKAAGEMHQGGFYRFSHDISKLVNYGKSNVLEEEVNKHSANASVNRAEREADFWIFEGIFRPIYLEVFPNAHFTRLAIDAKADGTFNSLIEIYNPPKNGRVKIEVREKGSGIVKGVIDSGEMSQQLWVSGKIEDIKSWIPEHPHLYEATFVLSQNDKEVFQKKETFGFRTVVLREQDGIYVNGKRVVFKGVKWVGDGPYRVWKNRLKGAEFGLWEKVYNNTMAGHSYDNLVYPEFKGYHANLYALEMQTDEGNIHIYSCTPGLFFNLYNPENPPQATPGTTPAMPKGDISFLHQISPIGNKFSGSETMGPSGEKGRGVSHTGDTPFGIKLWFQF